MGNSKIIAVKGFEILDSRGNPTVEAKVVLDGGFIGRAAAPSGASKGKKEAVEMRDGGKRMNGLGTYNACKNINGEIASALCGMDACQQDEIDSKLITIDGTENKSRLGANAIMAVSIATAKAAAEYSNIPLYLYLGKNNSGILPVPMMNLINGGMHANNNLGIQEFMIMTTGFSQFKSALFAGTEIFHSLKEILKKQGLSTAVGDEGGFAPNLKETSEALDLLMDSIKNAGYKPGEEIFIALDCAASEFFINNEYKIIGDNFQGNYLDMVEKLIKLKRQYPIISIEDGCAENDWSGWKHLTKKLNSTTQLVGDDLFVTNPEILQKGIEQKTANAILIKPNQIGTISLAKKSILIAKDAGYNSIMSHRSGETEDLWLADMSIAWDVGQIKTGAPCRGERTAKYNHLLRIEESLGSSANFMGKSIFNRKI